MTWPPQWPDLNPIEMVWDELDSRVKKKQPTSVRWTVCQCSRSVCALVSGSITDHIDYVARYSIVLIQIVSGGNNHIKPWGASVELFNFHPFHMQLNRRHLMILTTDNRFPCRGSRTKSKGIPFLFNTSDILIKLFPWETLYKYCLSSNNQTIYKQTHTHTLTAC